MMALFGDCMAIRRYNVIFDTKQLNLLKDGIFYPKKIKDVEQNISCCLLMSGGLARSRNSEVLFLLGTRGLNTESGNQQTHNNILILWKCLAQSNTIPTTKEDTFGGEDD